MMVFQLTAPLLGGAGVFLLWRSWQLKGQTSYVVMGWLFLLLAPFVWQRVQGVEFALIFTCIAMSFCAWIFIALNHERKPSKTLRETAIKGTTRSVKDKLILFVMAGPIALTASTFWSILLAKQLPFITGNQIVAAVFLLPIFWTLLMTWLCSTTFIKKPALVSVLATFLGAAFLYL